MGLSVGPQSFAPLTGDLQAQGKPADWRRVAKPTLPLDPLVAALGRAVERSARAPQESGDDRD